MKTITLKVTDAQYKEIKTFYAKYVQKKTGEYLDFYAKLKEVTVTGYINKKNGKTVVFSGAKAEKEAAKWSKEATKVKESKDTKTTTTKTTKEAPKKEGWLFKGDQIGSDEVGVGDFVGPMIVVACYVKKENIKYLDELGVKDSKKLTDAKIREIVPNLIKKVEFSKLTLSNTKYNAMIYKDENLNSLKAKMHNRALLNMLDKHEDVSHIYIDQFVEEKKYYEYLNDEEERKVKCITFQTKGESYYPCIAAASIIARYCFLVEMDTLSSHYKMEFPYGASSKVDGFAKEFIAKYGISEFNKIAKMNFANYKTAIKG